MKSTLQHASETQLQTLVFGDEQSDAYRSAMAHVEHCELCRKRLDEIAGPPSLDSETREFLSGSSFALPENREAGEGEFSEHHASDLDLAEYLNPPSHPEMLGRLGRYEIERMIGSGGMGVVFKGFDTELNRPVAVKVLARHLAHSGAARKRFSREAKAAAAVVNEHVAAIHNVETNGQTPFLVMQYVAGESLQSRVDRDGPLSPKELLRIGYQTAAGLQAAHEQGVVHRDIKPANILLEEGVDRALVTDFGLAQTVDDASLTQTGVVTGTPNYMSPEQANGAATNQRCDLFSLGSVLYFMATGHGPFRAKNAMGVLNRICHEPHTPVWKINPEIPDRVSEIIDRLLEKKPKRRMSSAAHAERELKNALADLQHHKPLPWLQLRRFTRRNQTELRVAGFSLILVLCLVFLAPLLFDFSGKMSANSETEFSEPVAVSDSFAANDQPAISSEEDAEPAFKLSTHYQSSSLEAEAWDANVSELNGTLDSINWNSPITTPADLTWEEYSDATLLEIIQLETTLKTQ